MARSSKEIAERLVLTQKALGLSAAEICKRTGIKNNAWSQFLNPKAKRPITRAALYRLKDEFGITFDWIYDGDPSGLPARLHQKIRVAA
jgi:transcriptional regulator with XRE-family HTH domain